MEIKDLADHLLIEEAARLVPVYLRDKEVKGVALNPTPGCFGCTHTAGVLHGGRRYETFSLNALGGTHLLSFVVSLDDSKVNGLPGSHWLISNFWATNNSLMFPTSTLLEHETSIHVKLVSTSGVVRHISRPFDLKTVLQGYHDIVITSWFAGGMYGIYVDPMNLVDIENKMDVIKFNKTVHVAEGALAPNELGPIFSDYFPNLSFGSNAMTRLTPKKPKVADAAVNYWITNES